VGGAVGDFPPPGPEDGEFYNEESGLFLKRQRRGRSFKRGGAKKNNWGAFLGEISPQKKWGKG